MTMRNMAWFAVVAALTGVVSPVAARSTGASEKCVFERYEALSVAPFNQEENYGLGTYTRLRGAQVYVAAQPGLTAEWLTRSVQEELSKLNGDAECRPSVNGVRVSVTSAGGGFWVALAAQDDRSAKALLTWARSIVPAGQ